MAIKQLAVEEKELGDGKLIFVITGDEQGTTWELSLRVRAFFSSITKFINKDPDLISSGAHKTPVF